MARNKRGVPHLVLPFFDVRDEFNGIVIRGERVVVPKSLHRDVLYRRHYAQSGVVSTLSLAREMLILTRNEW